MATFWPTISRVPYYPTHNTLKKKIFLRQLLIDSLTLFSRGGYYFDSNLSVWSSEQPDSCLVFCTAPQFLWAPTFSYPPFVFPYKLSTSTSTVFPPLLLILPQLSSIFLNNLGLQMPWSQVRICAVRVWRSFSWAIELRSVAWLRWFLYYSSLLLYTILYSVLFLGP